MMSILKDSFKAQQTTYEFSPEQIKLLVALDLGVVSERPRGYEWARCIC